MLPVLKIVSVKMVMLYLYNNCPQVGGRSVVNSDIEQIVEIRPEEDRFPRLLEILGEWYEKGKILVFVHSQVSVTSI
jgi:ATP-dependent RNA helicase DDX46/PRP5